MQWNPVNTDSEAGGGEGRGRGIETVHIKRVEVRDNVKAFFPQFSLFEFW